MLAIGDPSADGRSPAWVEAKAIIKIVADILMFVTIVAAPAVPYLKQYLMVRSSNDVGAFSTYVCAIVLYGQAFRILFW